MRHRTHRDWRSFIMHGALIGKVQKKTAQRRNFVTDQLNNVENTYDYHLLMVIVEALWTITAGKNNNTGEVLNFNRLV